MKETLTCNPGTLKETRDTCLPGPMIDRLVNEWNTRHPQKQIKQDGGVDKREKWIALRKAMAGECATEYCAAKKLIGKKEKEYKKFFRPEAPAEWKSDPDMWLNTDDIAGVMEQYEDAIPSFEFIGPVPIDFASKAPDPSWGKCVVDEMCRLDLQKMAKEGTKMLGICYNFDPHDKPGSHWVATILDLKKKAAYYFDSYGSPPPKQIAEFLASCKKQGIKDIQYNDIRHQQKDSECGMYSLYFMVSMIFGSSFRDICLDKISDERMMMLRKIFFSTEDVSDDELDRAFRHLPATKV